MTRFGESHSFTMGVRSTCPIDDLKTKDYSLRSLPRKFLTSSTMRTSHGHPRPGRRGSVSVNRRSISFHFKSSFLILTTILLSLCSTVVATSHGSCSHIDSFSRRGSHSFVLGRGARRDEINEITVDSRSDPQRLHPKRQQNDEDKSQLLETSNSSSEQEENAGPGAGSGDDNSPEDSSDRSNPKQDGSSEQSKDHSNSRTTSEQDQSSATTTATASDSAITASGISSAVAEIQTAPTIDSAYDLPKTFDSNIGSNYTNPNCPKFINELKKNSTYIDCHPMSMFLKNSRSFFEMSASASTLSQVLDASCAASESACTAVMTDLASRLTDDSICGEDFENRQPTVRDAYEGLVTYRPVYRASCLKNPETHSYCYVDASTDSSSFEDSYIYLTAVGFELPAGTRLTCNRCLQATMDIFADTARVEGQPLVNTYLPAANMINMGCGPGFINTTVEVGTLPAVDAASGSLLRSGQMLMGYVSFLSVVVTMFLF